jgi:tRNA G37 N-methylase TrmD
MYVNLQRAALLACQSDMRRIAPCARLAVITPRWGGCDTRVAQPVADARIATEDWVAQGVVGSLPKP